MKNFRKIQVLPSVSIRETIQAIDASAMQIVLVVTEDGRLAGTVTDGDIRRGILGGVSLDEGIVKIMNRQPNTCKQEEDRETILSRMRTKRLHHMPIVDRDGVLLGLETIDELLIPKDRENVVVLMAGGLGTRLHPLTEDCPKPMLKIGERPLLETILLNLQKYGFRNFYISVNYKSDTIIDYFGDGSRLDIEIQYLHESQKLGTAGALSLLPNQPEETLLVMNGDLLTKVNFNQMFDFHASHHAQATMCVSEYDFQVPYGVVNINGHSITRIDEKPVQHFFVNAGIYALEPRVLDLIPSNIYFDMPMLFEKLVESQEVAAFPLREYWLDIGRLTDFEQANGDFDKVFM